MRGRTDRRGSAPTPSTSSSRRTFLQRAGGTTLAVTGLLPLLASACSSSPAAAPSSGSSPGSAAGSTPAAGASAAQPVIHIAVGQVAGAVFSPFAVGVALGLFARDNIEVEIIEHRGGAEAAQAMVGGGVDIFNGDLSHALRLIQQGQQVRVICGTTDRHPYVLMGTPDARPDVQSLKGQKIGITSPGSQTDNSMRWLLKTNGIDPDKDVELVALGAGASMAVAVQNKQVYAGTVFQPFTSQLKLQNCVTVYSFTDEVGPFQGLVMMTRQALLQERGEAVRRFLRSYLGVVKLLHEDEATRTAATQKLYPQLDSQIAAVAVQELVKTYPADGKVTEEAVQKVLEFDRVARGSDQSAPPLQSFSDFSYLPA